MGALASLVLFATVTGARADEDLFPVKPGSSWKMKGSAGAQNVEMLAKIASSTLSGGQTVVLMKWTKGFTSVQDETYIVTKSQVMRAKSGANGSSSLNPPIPIISYPMTLGKTWNWSGIIDQKGGKTKARAILKVGPREKIKTSAGVFTACRVDMVLIVQVQNRTISMPNSYWFAPNVGMVQQKLAVPTPSGKYMVVQAVVTEVKVK